MENSTAPVILDLAGGIRRLAGDRELYKQIMEIFFSEATGQLHTLQQALDTRNANLVKLVSHSMKGAAANLGALRVQETAFKLEIIGADENLVGAPPIFEHLKNDVTELTDFWQTELAKMTD
jgi:HPt (histidine-containing phosphotransfer) domain-containing protein